jgi:hypothetical protein
MNDRFNSQPMKCRCRRSAATAVVPLPMNGSEYGVANAGTGENAWRHKSVGEYGEMSPRGWFTRDGPDIPLVASAAQAEARRTGRAHLHLHAVLVHSLHQLAANPGMGAIEPTPCITGSPAHEDGPPINGPVPVPPVALRW